MRKDVIINAGVFGHTKRGRWWISGSSGETESWKLRWEREKKRHELEAYVGFVTQIEFNIEREREREGWHRGVKCRVLLFSDFLERRQRSGCHVRGCTCTHLQSRSFFFFYLDLPINLPILYGIIQQKFNKHVLHPWIIVFVSLCSIKL